MESGAEAWSEAIRGDAAMQEILSRLFWLVDRLKSHFDRVAMLNNLTPTQAMALRDVSHPITMSRLAERVGCEPSNMTAIIDNFEARGLVRRRPGTTDRRQKQVSLTASGERLRNTFAQQLFENLPVAELKVEERNQLLLLVRRLITDWPGAAWER